MRPSTQLVLDEAQQGQLSPAQQLVPTGLFDGSVRGRLLAVAVQLFASRGYHGVSVRDIVSALDVKSSSLYAQFSSKESLYAELVYQANNEILSCLTAVPVSGSAADRLYGLVVGHVTFHATFPALARLAHNDLHVLSPASLSRVSESRRVSSEMFLAAVTAGNSQGDFTCAAPWLAVTAIASLGIRVATWYQPPGPHENDISYPAEVHDWMQDDVPVAQLCHTYGEYALGIVGFRGASPVGRV